MSLNRLQNLGYTIKYQIDTGRAIFLTYAQQKKMNELGRLLGYNLFSPDNSASIITQIEEGAAHTSLEELERYLEELLVQLDLVPPIPKRPNTPEIVYAEGGDNEAFIYFNTGKAVEDPVTNYKYSTDDGVTFRELSPADTISPITITNTSTSPFEPLVNGTPYTIRIMAINIVGGSDASNEIIVTPMAAPDPPTALTGQPGNMQASIFFTPGDDGGSSIVNYQYSTDDGSTFIALLPPTTGIIVNETTRYVIITRTSSDGLPLDDDVEYSIRLKAVTAGGPISAASESVLVTPASVPDTPILLSATSENAQTTVSFTPGTDDGGSPIINYAYSTDNGVTFREFSPPTTGTVVTVNTRSLLITNISASPFGPLENNKNYDIKLQAINTYGPSLSSAAISVTPSTIPNPPIDLSGQSLNQQARITFTEGFNGGSRIINYQYSTNGVTFRAFSPAVTTSPVTISTLSSDGTTLLANGTSYSIRLKAVNINGESATESTAVTVIPSTVPDPPIDLVGTHGNRQAIVTFTPGFDQGRPITNYRYSTDNGSTFILFNPPQTGDPVEGDPIRRSFTITRTSSNFALLTNGTPYSIRLKAVNSNGASLSWSDTVIVTPSTIPNPPTNLSGESLNQQARISFIAGTNGGATITNYQYSTDDGATFRAFSPVQTTSPVTISTLSSDGTTPLENDTAYTIRLKAVNMNGQSATASTSVIVIPSTVPDPPTALSGESLDKQAKITFTAGADQGSDITNYQYSTDNGTTFRGFSPVQAISPVTISTLSSDGTTLLVNGTPYTIRLKAVNVNGSSLTASQSVIVTPATVPDPPTDLSVE